MSSHPQIMLSYRGKSRSLVDWSERTGLSYDKLLSRYKKYAAGKLNIEDVFVPGSLPQRSLIKIEFEGKPQTLREIADKLGITVWTLKSRMRLIKKGQLDGSKLFVKGNINWKNRDFTSQKHYTLNDGTKISIKDLSRRAGVAIATINRMMRNGKTVDDIVEWIADPYRRIRSACWINGKRQNFSELCDNLGLGISKSGLSSRMKKSGWSFQEAISEPRVSFHERNKRVHVSRKRNRKLRELKRMGVVV